MRTERRRLRTARGPLRLTAAAALLGLLAGCYQYQPVLSPNVPSPGDQVRIAPVGWNDPDRPRDANEPEYVEGRVVEWGSDEVLLDIPPDEEARHSGEGRRYLLSDTVPFPVDRIGYVERRELDGWRTARWAVGGTAAVGLVITLLLQWVSNAGDGPSGEL